MLLLTSHSSLLLRLLKPPVRPPRLRYELFPLICLPHLLVLPATFGLHLLLQTYPYFPALCAVPVRQAKGLPTDSFRFHLTMDTLAVQLCASSLPTRTRDFHPLEPPMAGKQNASGIADNKARSSGENLYLLGQSIMGYGITIHIQPNGLQGSKQKKGVFPGIEPISCLWYTSIYRISCKREVLSGHVKNRQAFLLRMPLSLSATTTCCQNASAWFWSGVSLQTKSLPAGK